MGSTPSVWALFLAVLAMTGQTARAETANIAVAANFTAVAKQLRTEFSQQSDHNIKLSFGSTGKLYTQILHGAPFDAFLSADQQRPKRLLDQGAVAPGSRFTYAVGKLVLFSSHPTLDLATGKILSGPTKVQRLAIANPKTAPYGSAAREVLNAIKGTGFAKLIQGDSVVQTFQFVTTGNVDAGFVALAQVLGVPQANYWLVPQSLYSPLKQDAVMLTRGQDNPAARAFLQFLQSETARQIIQESGYSTDEAE